MSLASAITIHVPGPLRAYCGGASTLSLSAGSVRSALEQLEQAHPELHRNIRDETGAVRRHVNLFVNSDNIRDLAGLETELTEGDVLTVMPAVSGG